ncbi:unnamed protein product, partial [Larinioides sclopetarius]
MFDIRSLEIIDRLQQLAIPLPNRLPTLRSESNLSPNSEEEEVEIVDADVELDMEEEHEVDDEAEENNEEQEE